MKNKVAIHAIISSAICLLMMVVFLAFYAKLPNSVPIHWDTQGHVNNSIPKPWVVFGLPVAYVLVNLIGVGRLIAKKAKSLYQFYIIPVTAIIVTIVVLCLGLK